MTMDLVCPRCRFGNNASIKSIRIRDVIICRGCHANVRLDDHLNSVRATERRIRRALAELEQSLGKLSRTITIRI